MAILYIFYYYSLTLPTYITIFTILLRLSTYYPLNYSRLAWKGPFTITTNNRQTRNLRKSRKSLNYLFASKPRFFTPFLVFLNIFPPTFFLSCPRFIYHRRRPALLIRSMRFSGALFASSPFVQHSFDSRGEGASNRKCALLSGLGCACGCGSGCLGLWTQWVRMHVSVGGKGGVFGR